eukprot:CAMPEP_0170167496 /NCGR_PEP_ID=MMETSP0040_2-20121228/891_1 /TAXON_ID=641309 /ORGANISM="Lotharella oceanica, Strain CCMP622" /LENGTH=73 /DNA_ID=CAMNT_0010405543 /DNA_START=397 /DNA_END=618 /DNA_ORIENTATION=+
MGNGRQIPSLLSDFVRTPKHAYGSGVVTRERGEVEVWTMGDVNYDTYGDRRNIYLMHKATFLSAESMISHRCD